MGAAVNGMAAHGGVLPFSATFFVFSDYMKPAIRLGALMGLRAIYVFTHDSIGVGEDGPTHQPIEQLAMLRAIPGMVVIRPADANEVAEAWRYIMPLKHEPTCLVVTRQGVDLYVVFASCCSPGSAEARCSSNYFSDPLPGVLWSGIISTSRMTCTL